MAFDTEHAYANGFDLSDLKMLRYYKQIIDVIHFNAIPSQVVQGGHLDRHSDTNIDECKEGADYIMRVFSVLYSESVPVILERGGYHIAKRDLDFINNYCGGV